METSTVVFFGLLQAIFSGVFGVVTYYLNRPKIQAETNKTQADSVATLLQATNRFSEFIERLITQRDEQDKKMGMMGDRITELEADGEKKAKKITELSESLAASERRYDEKLREVVELRRKIDGYEVKMETMGRQHGEALAQLKLAHDGEIKQMKTEHGVEIRRLETTIADLESRLAAQESRPAVVAEKGEANG